LIILNIVSMFCSVKAISFSTSSITEKVLMKESIYPFKELLSPFRKSSYYWMPAYSLTIAWLACTRCCSLYWWTEWDKGYFLWCC
jgi:hypothetical protein